MMLVIALAAGFVLASLSVGLGVYLYGSMASRATGAPSKALPVGGDTDLDRLIAPLADTYPEQSGLLLSDDNLHAFAVRAISARAAGRSLDLQYYYWKDDLTGALLAAEVLRAADRGVRVRLLLDDINLGGRDARYLAFDAHPNVEVRVFNPCWNREGALRRGVEILLRGFSSTRRMHNKAWIADGRVAIVGGRNVGDAYFDASDTMNFSDMDLVVAGPAVAEADAVFDRFWNSPCVFPIASLPRLDRGDLDSLRRRLAETKASSQAKPYLARMARTTVADLLPENGATHWVEGVRIVSDPPAKSDGRSEHRWLHKVIVPMVMSAARKLDISSPYFIPGERGVAQLVSLVREGVDVTVLTNSLAATDVAAVHGAYAPYRKPLLAGGVRLHELKPEARRHRMSLFGSSGASLHTKAFVVDGHAGFVGSFNFDPRSVSLNTEMGVVFDDEALAAEITDIFRQQTAPGASYSLGLDGRRLVWRDREGGGERVQKGEPAAGLWRRIVATVIGWLPLESQL